MTSSDRVLVIEPDAAARRRYTGWLKTEGLDVEAAANEHDAVGVLERASLRLILATIEPAAGDALIGRLRAARPDVAVVAIAADNGASVAAIERGAVHCLMLPVKKEPLRRMIAFVMKQLPPTSAPALRRTQLRASAGSVSATDAKNEFAALLDTAVTRGPVLITKHDAPRAVLLGLEDFDALASSRGGRISALTVAFDELLERMQRPGARARMQAAFDASSDELGDAAVRAARQG